MNIIILLYFLIFLLYIILYSFVKNKDKREKLFINISFIVLIFVLSTRTPYSDMHNYINYFHSINNMSLSNFMSFDLELLYKVLNLIIGKIWLNDRFFITIVSIITCIGPYFFIKKRSKNYLLSILLFISIGTFRLQFYIIRQSIALTFLLLGLNYIDDKKTIKFLLMVIVASLFHQSALIFVLIYLLNKFKGKTKVIISIALVFATFLLKDQLYSLIGYSSYNNYMLSSIEGEGYGLFALYVLIIAFSLFFKPKKKEENADLCVSMSFMALILQVMSTRISILSRIVYYFSNGLIIYPVDVIESFDNKRNKMILSMIMCAMILIYLAVFGKIIGYSTVFN